MSKIHVAPELALPIEVVTEKLAFLGRTGSGKTYAALKLAEEMDRVHAQFIALDPVGKWWSLRLAGDGVSPGIAIPVFGGLHGDVPLEPTAGKLVADVVADRGISVVLDVSQFESDADKARFATAFADRFFFHKKSQPSAVHLFIEEAQEFVPQNPQRDEAKMLHAFTRIWKLGRNFGIGGSLLSQRPQEINKKVLNQTELLFCFQMTGPQERKAIDGWIREKGIDEDISAELPKLARGHAHAWSPAWLQISKVGTFGERWTFDASSTPKVGAKVNANELAPIDLEQLRTDMAATIEKAKAEDPRELKKRIATLEAEARKKHAPAPASIDSAGVQRQVDRAIAGLVKESAARDQKVMRSIDRLGDLFTQLSATAASGAAVIPAIRELLASPIKMNGHKGHTPTATAAPTKRPPVIMPQSARAPRTASRQADGGSLPRGEAAILTAAAQYPDGVSREQLSVLTGYKRSSRDAYLQRLSQAGFVALDARGAIQATDEGVAALGDAFEPLPTGAELRAHWLTRLRGGEQAILEALVAAYPDSTDRGELSARTNYKRSSRDTYIQRLRSRKLVEDLGDSTVRASDILFDS